jgi:hypothetical protein
MNAPAHFGLIAAALLFPVLPLLAKPAKEPVKEPAKAPAAPAVVPENKPYVLFMRTDVAVEQEKKLYPIKDVTGRMFIIAVKGKNVAVPMTGIPHRLEFQHALTLARASVSLTGLESGRAYTPGRDPKMKRQREAVLAEAVAGDNASLAEGKFIAALNHNFTAINSDARAPDGSQIHGAADAAAALEASSLVQSAIAFQAQGMAENMQASDLASGAFARLAAESDMKQELFDAVEVHFELSSSFYLTKPYVVVMTRFHTRDDRPGVARNAVFAKALEPIGSKPEKIDLLHGGFPLGFEIEELQVHVYNDGQEVPTEIAQKRVPLTRDEAFEYLKIDYFRGHKHETVLASPAVGRPAPVDIERLGPKRLAATFYVKVDKDGRPLGTYIDEDCTQPADPMVAGFAGEIRFFPALDEGKPVAGVAHLVFGRVAL